MRKNITIIGLGWLGLPLAKQLISKGYDVKGSVTSIEKRNALLQENIETYQIILSETAIEGEVNTLLSNTEIVVIAIPPGFRKNPNKNYVNEIKLFQKKIVKAKIPKVLYISSTAVFKDISTIPIYTEENIPNETSSKAKQLIEVEGLLKNTKAFSTTILRLGGLVGKSRHPINYLSGKKNVVNPEAPVNLIHLEDAISMILKIIETERWEETFHGVFPAHPVKKIFYVEAAKRCAISPPNFDFKNSSEGKIISSEKTIKKLAFSFQYKP